MRGIFRNKSLFFAMILNSNNADNTRLRSGPNEKIEVLKAIM
jgi:hypothetical protein